MEVGALLFDTRSIQKYIFSGNKLKTNIGASFIVEHLFEDILVGDVLSGKFSSSLDSTSWTKQKENVKELPADCYVAYIGGGDALILLKEINEEKARDIVGDFTEKLLVTYPGLKTGAAIGKIDLEHFEDGLNEMYRKLKANQNTVFPLVNVPYTGLTLTCEVNGEAANSYDNDRKRYYSQEVMVKKEIADEANRKMHDRFQSEIGNYDFPVNLSDLGQTEGHNDIAIIHMDGNNMGVRFSKCKTLTAHSRLSRQVSSRTETAFRELLKSVVSEMDVYKKHLSDRDLKKYLPLRPLILGGDDVTFVCNARLALVLTKRLMEYMVKPAKGLSEEDKLPEIDTCAGIAILNTNYPFFRGYELAEQLCDEAKKKVRGVKPKQECWLDFGILHGEQAPTLDQIRENEYTGAYGRNMHFGPYRVDGDSKDAHHISRLLEAIRVFTPDQKRKIKGLPRNKFKGLRFALQHGDHEIRQFLEQLEHDKKEFPRVDGWEDYEKNLWYPSDVEKSRTPYVDVIEMSDYVLPE